MMRRTLMLGLICLLAACGSSPKTEFYILNVDEKSTVESANENVGPAVGVWTVILPEALDRSEIVTRENWYKIKRADFAWWAGALDQNLTLLIATKMSEDLQSNRVVMSPWPTYVQNDYQITILINRFDGELGGDVVLSGLWNILDGNGNEQLSRQIFEFKTNTTDTTYQAMVEAMSQLAVQLSKQLVEGVIDQESK